MTDELEDEKLDLSAWEAPAPPDDLADAVIARMTGTGVVPSVPDVQAPRRRVGVIAGVAVGCLAAAAGVFLIMRGTERAAPTSGQVVASSAQTLSLDGVRAELDPGTKVSWVRTDGVLRVQQAEGAAAWRVTSGERIQIDAGATVASVEATGASLRVEVKMNQTDARLIGSAALTAMAVSMVTVVVYEGHVKVSGSPGQPTVIVQPGSTYTVTPPPVKAEPPLVGASVPVTDQDEPMLGELRIAGGESATIHAASFPVTVEFPVPTGCTLEVEGSRQTEIVADLEPGVVTYRIECGTESQSKRGTLTLVVDDAKAPLAERQLDTVKLRADGRAYNVVFRDIVPSIEVAGSGTLHVQDGSKELTFTPGVIPAGQLAAGQYTYWFDPALKSTLTLDVDYASPMLRFDSVTFGEEDTTIIGETLAQSTVSVRGVTAPLMQDGRFQLQVAEGDAFAVRVTHPHRGNHYYVLRSPRAVASVTGGLTRTQIMKVMTSVRDIQGCGTRAKANRSGQAKIVVKVEVAPTGVVTSVRSVTAVDADVESCVVGFVRTMKFPATKQRSSFSFPYQIDIKPVCDATALETKGWDYDEDGKYAAALMQFEAALKCVPNDWRLMHAAYKAACNSRNGTKAKEYFNKFSIEDQEQYEYLCTEKGISVVGMQATTCDAEALKEKGMTHINSGQHAAALTAFEASLKCKDDVYIRQLAFMESCASGNSVKAKLYYKKLTPAQQTKFAQLCIRQKPPVAYEDDGEPESWGGPDDGTKGYLQVSSKPDARILIDGVDTGLTTPITAKQLMLTPGRHKVTFVIDEDRFTYPVTITAGQTERMSKDLQ